VKRHEKHWAGLVHESAHVAAILHYELGLEYVQLNPPTFWSPDPHGEPYMSDYGVTEDELAEDPDAIIKTEPAARLVVCLVGASAQYRAIVEGGRSRWAASRLARAYSEGDRALAARITQYSPWSWREAQQEADNLVDYYWDDINRLAVALRDAGGYLDGDEAASVFGGASA